MVASDLNTYDIMNCTNLVFVDNAHEVVEDLLKKVICYERDSYQATHH